MRSERSEVGSKGGRVRPKNGSRRGPIRSSQLRRLALEGLETRTLLATTQVNLLPQSVLPAATVESNSQYDISTQSPINPNSPNTSGGTENDSSPSIVVDQNNPLKMAATWTLIDPRRAPGPTIVVAAAVSNDGGRTWTQDYLDSQFGFTQTLLGNGLIANPTTTNPVVSFAQADNASVGFDRNDNLYILRSEHSADNSVGALVLDKYNFSGSVPVLDTTNGDFQDKPVYEWVGSDAALLPTMVVDDNVATFSDTDFNGVVQTQNDRFSGNVYIAWTSNDTPFTNAGNNFNPNRIKIVASSDGGQTFTGNAILNNNGNNGPSRETAPRLAVSQGRPINTAVYGPFDQGVPGGQVTAVWDDFNSFANANPPFDAPLSNRIPNGAVGTSFTSPGGTVVDATAGPQPTDFPVNVNVTDPRFINVSDVEVSLNLVSATLAELSVVLIPPPGSGLSPITLFQNQTNAAGTANTAVGISGANLGISANGTRIGTTFDDRATRRIIDRTAAAPFIGHFRPEGGSLDTRYAGATPTLGAGDGSRRSPVEGFREKQTPVPESSPMFPNTIWQTLTAVPRSSEMSLARR